MTSTPRLNYVQIFLIGLGFFGVSVIWGIYNAFVPIFLQNRFGLSPSWIAFFMTLDNIAALLIQPPIGGWSDKLNTPIGRRMPFILVGAPLGAAAFGILPLAHILPVFVCCTSTLLLSMAMWRTPVVALMPDVTPSQFRSQANAIINFMGGVGALFAYFGGGLLYKMNPSFPFLMGGGLVIVATLLLFIFVREPKVPLDNDGDESPRDLLGSLIFLVREQEKSALFFLLALFCWMIGYSAIESFWTLYAANRLGIGEANATLLLGVLSLVFLIVALPVGYMARFFSRKALIGAGLVLLAALFLVIFALPVAVLKQPVFSLPILGTVPILGTLLMGCGVAWALITIHALPMIVDMTDASRNGTYTGLYYLFSTFASIVGPNVNGLLVQMNGNNYNILMLSAPIWTMVGFGLLMKVRRGEMTPLVASVGAESAPPLASP
ncbi:MFS transporter [bacterium]|nr:MAG: MFS transporter [bacterium]